MATALLIARLLLAAVFAVAAAAKLADRAGAAAALRAFGVPDRLARPSATALPLAVLAVAVMLVAPATARPGAIAAGALLAGFSAAIARAMARGEAPECHCFGAIHPTVAGPSALARNLGLGFLAVAVAAAGPAESLGQALRGSDPLVVAAVAAAAVVLVIQAWLGLHLVAQNGRLLERLRALEETVTAGTPATSRRQPGLTVGSRAPSFALPDLDGELRTLRELLARGVPVALAFSEPGCAACASLPAALARVRAQREGELEVVLVSRGTSADNRARVGGHELGAVLLQDEREVALAFAVSSVPCATIVGADGRVAAPLAIGLPAIEALIASYDDEPATPVALRVVAG